MLPMLAGCCSSMQARHHFAAVDAGNATTWNWVAARAPKRDVMAHAQMATMRTMAASERPMPRPRPSC